MHLQHSECREHSQNSRIKQAVGVAVTVSAEYTKRSAASSDFPEDSQNSLPSSEREMDNGEANMSLVIVMVIVRWWSANSENFLQTRGWKWKAQKADKRSDIPGLCVSVNPANIHGIR